MRRLSHWLIALLMLGLASCQSTELEKTDEKVGAGPEAKPGDVLVVHYTGRLSNGTKFDSSKDRGEPFEFPLGQGKVIKGWDQGLVGMKAGGVRKLVVPPSLGYGSNPPKGSVIQPGAVLVFDVELLEINPPPPKVQITDIKEGSGDPAKIDDVLEVHFIGTFKDGKKFEDSRDKKKTFKFRLGAGEVMPGPGWDQGLTGMRQGGIRKIVIPPKLAYGAKGRLPLIPPNAELTFEVELISIRRD